MRTRQIAVSLILPLALAISTQALAAEPSNSPVRSAQYQQGHAAIVAKDWTKAYEIFLDLWSHSKGADRESDVLLNLGQAELMTGRPRDAAEHLSFGIFMTSPDEVVVRERAGKGLERAKKKIGTLMIVAPEGTQLAINGKSIGTAPIVTEVFVDPGSVLVTGRHPTKGIAESKFEVKAAEQRTVELKPQVEPSSTTSAPLKPPYASSALGQPKAQPIAPIMINPPPPIERHDGIGGRTLVLIGGGVVTLAAVGAGTYFGLSARSDRKDAERLVAQNHEQFGINACAQATDASADLCSRISNKNEDRRNAARAANISFAIGGIAAVATGLTYLLWPRPKPTTSAFVMVPVVAPHTGGLSIQGDF